MKTAFYLITIVPSNGKKVSAVRQLEEEPIDKLWNQYQMKANGVYRDLKYFNIVLLSRYSLEVRDFLKKKETKKKETSGPPQNASQKTTGYRKPGASPGSGTSN
jgi:hypothetical protein